MKVIYMTPNTIPINIKGTATIFFRIIYHGNRLLLRVCGQFQFSFFTIMILQSLLQWGDCSPYCFNQRLRIKRYRLPIFSCARPVRTPRSCKSLISAFREGSVTETVRRPLQTVTEPSGTLILVFSAASIRLIRFCSAAESSARIESRCPLIAAILRTAAEMSVVFMGLFELKSV